MFKDSIFEFNYENMSKSNLSIEKKFSLTTYFNEIDKINDLDLMKNLIKNLILLYENKIDLLIKLQKEL